MKNLKLNPFSSLLGAKRSKQRGNLRNLATLNQIALGSIFGCFYTLYLARHPEDTSEGSAQLTNLADSPLSLRMTETHFEFLIHEAL